MHSLPDRRGWVSPDAVPPDSDTTILPVGKYYFLPDDANENQEEDPLWNRSTPLALTLTVTGNGGERTEGRIQGSPTVRECDQ